MSRTPLEAGSRYPPLGRRTSARLAHRGQPLSHPTIADSSDDEVLSPMKLSAITKALLGGGRISDSESPNHAAGTSRRTSIPAPVRPTSGDQESSWKRTKEPNAVSSRPQSPIGRPHSRTAARRGSSSLPTPVAPAPKEVESALRRTRVTRHSRCGSNQSSRQPSPVGSRESSPAPRKRIVRLNAPNSANGAHNSSFTGSQRNSLRNSLSSSTRGKGPGSSDGPKATSSQSPSADHHGSAKTPVVPVRTVRITVGSSGHKPAPGGSSDSRPRFTARSGEREVQPAPSAPPAAAPQSSMRVKRVGKTPGSFLSGPARRGRRRQSEDEVDGQSEMEAFGSGQEPPSQQPRVLPDQQAAFSAASEYPDFAASGSPVSARDTARAALRRHKATFMTPVSQRKPVQTHQQLVYRIPSPPAPESASEDKENEAPAELAPVVPSSVRPTSASRPIESEQPPSPRVPPMKLGALESLHQARAASSHQAYAAPSHPILSARSHNTAQRPAPPPPPKMSVAETATTAAGASTTVQANKKKQFLLRVNGKTYTRIDALGRGGSGKVYRVSAENGKLLALKRVSLENLDERVIKGYQGEIDLLQRLAGVSRVIQLIDHEFNAEKKMLSLVLEAGELDFNTFLRSRSYEDSRFDPVFIRYWWKEMVECVQAVHDKDILHTDLKPANFVIAQGRLKVIDFGIANAIQTDMTVNVHRDAQIGTPNYMSPESLMDSKEYALTTARNGQVNASSLGRPKHFKLGKASDVWSLGCILYQMVYGQCPFAKIANMMVRVNAIKDWNHAIDFPEHTEDGSRVPPSLIRTMRRCLNRNAMERPTCDELLSPTDPFLYPLELHSDIFAAADHGKVIPITQTLLRDVVWDVAQRVRRGDVVDSEILNMWPSAYWASCKKSLGMRLGGGAAQGGTERRADEREMRDGERRR